MSLNNLKKFLVFLLVMGFLATFYQSAYAYVLPKVDGNTTYSSDVELLQKMSRGISEIASKAHEAVVFVSISKTVKAPDFYTQNPFDFFFGPPDQRQMPMPERKQKGLGSGFFVDLKRGLIITNNHVIEGADEITMKLANGDTYDGKVIGRDQNTDIAVVEIKDKNFNRKNLSELRLGDSEELRVGEIVVALGAPFGLESSISLGVVSAIKRRNLHIAALENFIQTDAAINPGNSGGPLLNAKGHVIGMNTAIYSRSGASAGIGFAVPSSLVRTIATQLIDKGKVSRGYLGVSLSQELDSDLVSGLGLPADTKGALVSQVQPATPAAKGGLEAGDVIVAVNGEPIHDNASLTTKIGLLIPGEKVKLDVFRNAKRINLTITLGEFPADNLAGRQPSSESHLGGLTLREITPANARALQNQFRFESKSGLLVVDIQPNSKAMQAGLKPGDVIVQINRNRIKSIKEFEKIHKSSAKILLNIERQGNFLFAYLRK